MIRDELSKNLRPKGSDSVFHWLALGLALIGLLCPIELRADDKSAPSAQQEKKSAGQAEQPKSDHPQLADDIEEALDQLFRGAQKPQRPPTKPVAARRSILPRVFSKDTPSSLFDLQSIEEHVRDLVARVSPAVVAVEVGGATGSGVVISADGLVLSAAHVCDRPGESVVVTFPDGKKARGKTLGTNHEDDAGLLKITEKGPWPHVEVGELDRGRLGDWVLALGHPGGFDPERSMVVRLGRIIRLATDMLQTDCTLIGGDSGGPLFDMHGRVVGIHSRISGSTAENFHVAIGAFDQTWDRLAKSENWGGERQPQGPPWVGAFGLPHPDGLRVELVNRNGPAEKAGLKIGDIVTKFNGHAVKDFDAFKEFVSRTKVGEVVTFDLIRDDMPMTLKITVGARR